MKINIKWVTLIMLLATSLLFQNCKYYVLKEATQRLPAQRSNHYVIHLTSLGSEMLELTSVTIDPEKQTISGTPIKFTGAPRDFYEQVALKVAADSKSSHSARYKRSAESRAAILQTHIYISGAGYDNSVASWTIPYDEISKVEIMKNNGGKNFAVVVVPITVGVVAAIGITTAIVCNCPHVYVDNEGNYELNTTLFTGALAPQLERHDYKILPDYLKDSNSFEIKIANEENEDQYTNLLELLAINHHENESVLSDKNGNIYTIKNPAEPIEALDNSLHSIHDQVRASDNDIYKFDADSLTGLSEAFFTFDKPESADRGKLILRVKNSNWSANVYNEFNSLFGKRYSKWVERNKDKSKEEREKWMMDQGINLLVDIKTDNGWKNIDRVELVGEVSYHSIVIPLAFKKGNSNLEIRLRSGFKFWELDYAGMDFSEDSPLEIQRLKPIYAKGSNGEDFADALSSDDSKYMEHLGKGSSTLVRFEPITVQKGKSRTIIIHSKGYYLYNKEYEGKTYTKELAKFRNAGELSRFSKSLYDNLHTGITR